MERNHLIIAQTCRFWNRNLSDFFSASVSSRKLRSNKHALVFPWQSSLKALLESLAIIVPICSRGFKGARICAPMMPREARLSDIAAVIPVWTEKKWMKEKCEERSELSELKIFALISFNGKKWVLVVSAQLIVGFGQDKTIKQAIPWMPLTTLFRLQSSILTRVKRATNRNVATETYWSRFGLTKIGPKRPGTEKKNQ